MQLKAILCRTSTKKRYAMHTIKLLLTYYLNISVQAANLSDCRIESKLFFRIGMLYHLLTESVIRMSRIPVESRAPDKKPRVR